jgi:hypothetical protein
MLLEVADGRRVGCVESGKAADGTHLSQHFQSAGPWIGNCEEMLLKIETRAMNFCHDVGNEMSRAVIGLNRVV